MSAIASFTQEIGQLKYLPAETISELRATPYISIGYKTELTGNDPPQVNWRAIPIPPSSGVTDAEMNSILDGICTPGSFGSGAGCRESRKSAILAGKLDWNYNKGCASVSQPPGTGTLLAGTAEKIGESLGAGIAGGELAGLAGLAVGSAAAAAVTAGVGAVIAIPFLLSAHHAAAVKRENSTLCQIVPQVNNSIAQIDAWFQSGKLDPDQAQAAFAEVFLTAQQEWSGITKWCNEACGLQRELIGIILYRMILYGRAYRSRKTTSKRNIGLAAAAVGLGVAAVHYNWLAL